MLMLARRGSERVLMRVAVCEAKDSKALRARCADSPDEGAPDAQVIDRALATAGKT